MRYEQRVITTRPPPPPRHLVHVIDVSFHARAHLGMA